MRVLVIGAHPDDEILGVGGTICKHVANNDSVFVCIVTEPYEPEWSRKYIEAKVKQQKEVDEILNIKKRFNLNLPTVKLNTIAHGDLSNRITNIINKVNPDIVYTHYEHDLNQDHIIIFRTTVVATRPPKRIKLLCYESLSSTEWATKSFQSNVYIDIKDFIEKKIDTFKIYEKEVRDFPNPRSIKGIKILARKRGTEAGMEYAEGFVLIRDLWF